METCLLIGPMGLECPSFFDQTGNCWERSVCVNRLGGGKGKMVPLNNGCRLGDGESSLWFLLGDKLPLGVRPYGLESAPTKCSLGVLCSSFALFL